MVEFAQQLLTSHPNEAALAFSPLMAQLELLLADPVLLDQRAAAAKALARPRAADDLADLVESAARDRGGRKVLA